MIAPADAKYLIDVVGENQWTLSNEIDKLASYSSQVTRATIDELAVPGLENNTFILPDP